MWACTAKAEEDQENYLAEQERLEQFSSGVCVCVCVCVCVIPPAARAQLLQRVPADKRLRILNGKVLSVLLTCALNDTVLSVLLTCALNGTVLRGH